MAYAAAKLSQLQNGTSALSGLCRDEILRRLLTDVANELRDRGALDEEECFIDTAFVIWRGRDWGNEARKTHENRGDC
jgi:hypothetical protein